MADPLGNSGIRAEGLRPVTLLKKDNYRAWSTKLKSQLKVMDCWGLVTGVELQPAATGPPGCTPAETAVALGVKRSWDKRRDRATAVLIASISDEEMHTIHPVDEDPVQIWIRLREKFQRISEAEAEAAHMRFLDFAHIEGESANETIERFEMIVKNCDDQNVVPTEHMQKRMFIGRPAEKYNYLKQNYLLTPVATQPNLEALKGQLRDIDSDLLKPDSGIKSKTGQANRAEGEANWGQGSSSGQSKRSDKFGGKASRGGRGSGRERGNNEKRERGSSGARDSDVTCYCCGQRGHIKPNCPKREEKCRTCGKAGHLSKMCKSGSSSEGPRVNPEAGQFDDFESLMCDVTIGEIQAEGLVVEEKFVGKAEQVLDTWLGDSGSSHHIKSSSAGMVNVTKCPPGTKIRQVQGVVEVKEWGTVLLQVDGADGKRTIKLEETLIVPDIKVNLFSLQRVIKRGFLPVYGEVEGKCLIMKKTSDGKMIQHASMTMRNGRATLDCKLLNSDLRSSGPAPQIESYKVELDIQLLHRRLGHSGNDAMQKLLRGNMVRGIDKVKIKDLSACDFCKLGKATQQPHPAGANRGAELLGLVVVDLAGPNRPQTLGGKLYDMLIMDTFSQRIFIKLLAKKSDAADVLMRWIPQVEVQTGKKLKVLRSDNGGEFLSGKFTNWLSLRGTTQQTTPSYSPQSNSFAERGNRTIQDKARTMMLESGLPGSLWGEVMLTSCVLRNLTPTSSLSVTPLEMWTGKKPSVEHLRAVGCKAFCPFDKKEMKGKFGAKAWVGVLVGYSMDTAGYRVWDPVTHKVWDVRGPIFDEMVSGGWWRKPVAEKKPAWEDDAPFEPVVGMDPPVNQPGAIVPVPPADGNGGGDEDGGGLGGGGPGGGGPLDDVDEDADDEPLQLEGVPEPQAGPRMSQRERRGVPAQRLIEIMAAAIDSDNGGAPTSYEEALQGAEGEGWKKAFDAEVKSLNDNKVYSVVDRPPGKKVVKAKWVLRRKLLPNGKLDKLKARIVAKGFTQREGIDYEETFSPTVRFESVRLMVAAAAADDMHTHQMDVTTAFLYASLDEEVYMELMEGMEGYGTPGKVARLNKAIYGLKQASRMWNQHIDRILEKMGFYRLTADHGVYYKWDGVNRVWLALYVDDIFLISKNLANIVESKKTLGADMKVKDLGVAQYLLGIELRRRQLGMQDGDILMVQEKYVMDILRQFDMVGCKAASTPLEPGVKLTLRDSPGDDLGKARMEEYPYRQVVGKLMYLAICTRPDICQAVSELSRFNSNPGLTHWESAIRVLRYLKGTAGVGLLFKKGESKDIWGYVDASHTSCPDSNKGRAAYVFMSGGAPVSWASKRVGNGSLSSCETEYMGLTLAAQESCYLGELRAEMYGVAGKKLVVQPMDLLTDSRSAKSLAENPVYHGRSKHILSKWHFIRKRVVKGFLRLVDVRTELMAADMMTKAVGPAILGVNMKLLGMSASG